MLGTRNSNPIAFNRVRIQDLFKISIVSKTIWQSHLSFSLNFHRFHFAITLAFATVLSLNSADHLNVSQFSRTKLVLPCLARVQAVLHCPVDPVQQFRRMHR